MLVLTPEEQAFIEDLLPDLRKVEAQLEQLNGMVWSNHTYQEAYQLIANTLPQEYARFLSQFLHPSQLQEEP